MFDEEVDRQSREYQDYEYDDNSVASNHSSNRKPAHASSKDSYEWHERGQAVASIKKVIS